MATVTTGLPLEILQDILHRVKCTQSDVASLCLVSRSWYFAAIEFLYEAPKFTTYTSLKVFLGSFGHRNIGFIKSLNFSGMGNEVHSDSLAQITAAYQRYNDLSPIRPPLTRLNLHGCWHISDSSLIALLTACAANLDTLVINQCEKITTCSLFVLATYSPNLRHLSLRMTRALPPSDRLHHIFKYQRLQSLDLSYCTWVMQDTLSNDISHIPTIRALYLHSCNILGPALAAFVATMPALEELDISRMMLLTDNEIAEVMRAGKRLRRVSMQWTLAGEKTVRVMAEEAEKWEAVDCEWSKIDVGHVQQMLPGARIGKLEMRIR
ncbi:hypothetical protein BC936DRAFT_143250 [Jimgerdemannia flammicorona]|uniref:Uncharacterized protein n=2 Tax=Jimgerdemannia flammicorona TaxID=994334 RepID=A0A432ZZ74_9FUNG|nr:hypothetical protein BC936DRAFT_143250 [Jimgerdemannia flammicorona]RUS15250.1 hypothetical protein BC938DRAFT_477031 [Jimgerdemannia flammicorona]